jgi:hypothetical protein
VEKLCNKELRGLYSSPNIAAVIKSRGVKWLGLEVRVGETEK